MANINNQKVTDRILEDAKISVSEGVPNQISNVIAPVLISNPMPQILAERSICSDATSATLFTTSSTKKTFLVGMTMSYAKDAVSDSTNSSIRGYPKGKPKEIFLELRYEPITAGNGNEVLMLPQPMELEPNSAITIENLTATASIDVSGIIYYYEVDSYKNA